ncbi:MAG TPA: hypothetical protein VJB14_04760 [Planctomycetota bacterium]|nr:hypothetical protein [Planctomycetota bacterium]
MAKPFVTMDARRASIDARAVVGNLKKLEERYLAAVPVALSRFGEFLGRQAARRAPVGIRKGGGGGLRESLTVTEPRLVAGNVIRVEVGFNKPYAAIRDQGGTIKPVRAKALFIPLKPGARPGDPDTFLVPRPGKPPLVAKGRKRRGKKLGIEAHLEIVAVLVKEVTQKGNGYLTNTFQELAPRAGELVSEEVRKIMAAGA